MRLVPEPSDAAGAPRDGAAPLNHHLHHSSPLAEISNAAVRLYKTAFGRGPTQVRTRFAGPDTVVILLEETMTVSERKLADLGEHEPLRAHRLLLHGALEQEIRDMVERILGRRALGVISGIDTRRDVAAEVIMLAPAPHLDPDMPA